MIHFCPVKWPFPSLRAWETTRQGVDLQEWKAAPPKTARPNRAGSRFELQRGS